MEKKEIRLTNRKDVKMALSLEPEGTIYELLPGQSVIVELFATTGPTIDLQLREDKDGTYLSIWPEQGRYELNE